MKKEVINPCPRCSETSRLYVGSAYKRYWVICGKCFAESLVAESKKDAVWLWNRNLLRDENEEDEVTIE